MKNVRLSVKQDDYRPSMAADDVQGLTIEGLQVIGSSVMPSLHVKASEKVVVTSADLPGGKKAGIRYR
jgi:hypothetical protein